MSSRARVGCLAAGLLSAVAIASSCDARPREPDLNARFELARVDGVRFELARGERGPPERICVARTRRCERAPSYDINWGSAPERVTPIHVAREELEGARVLVRTERGAPLVFTRGRRVVLAVDASGSVVRWPYFNYLLYSAASDAAGRRAERFAEWASSPMPGPRTRTAVALAAALLWALVSFAFVLARRRGRARPDAAADFFRSVNAAGAKPSEKAPRGSWTRAGFARPLAGFLTLLAAMSFVAGLYLALQWVLGNKVQPFPEADGLWRTPFDVLWIAWVFFDAGTQVASVKYFAEHRVASPARALGDVQFYVWWQLFSKLAQGSALCAIAIGYLPYSQFAVYAPFVTLYGAVFLPALSPLGRLVTGALQRFDAQNLLDMLEQRVIALLMPIPFVLLGRAWGAAHPIYGEAFGAALGLGLGQLATFGASIAVGLWVLRRIGAPIGPLFLAQFDRETVRSQLAFGFKIMIGHEPFRVIGSFESIIIIALLRDFTAWQGIRDLLSHRLLFLFHFAWMFYMSGLPAFSEAFAAGKRRLTQYYVARFFQFGYLFSATIFSLMIAVGPSFIEALGPQWARAQPYLLAAMSVGLLLPPAWVSDALQQGTGRAWTLVVVLLVEQLTRLGLFFLLVPELQFGGIVIATPAALVVKAIVGWSLNHRRIVPLRLSLWATFGAPAIAGAVNYGIWRALVELVPLASVGGMLGLVCVASAASFFVVFFVVGLAGGYDAQALEELEQASAMMVVLRPVGRALSGAARFGARLARWRVAPLPFADEARAEAAELDDTARRALEAAS